MACPTTGGNNHAASCYTPVLFCPTTEHVHTPSCEDKNGDLRCSMNAHSHGGACWKPSGPNCGGS